MTAPSDKKLTVFMWIIGIIVTVFCGAGLTVALSYGGTKQKVETHDIDITQLKRTSVNYIYIEYLVESNQKLMNISLSKSGTQEMATALKEWSKFQDEILRRGNPTRGGSANNGAN